VTSKLEDKRQAHRATAEVSNSGFFDGGIEDLFFDGGVNFQSSSYLIENVLLLLTVVLGQLFFLLEHFLDRRMICFQQRNRVLLHHLTYPMICIARIGARRMLKIATQPKGSGATVMPL
jgi:hypothetical protein